MALIPCSECGRMISSFANSCPSCGAPNISYLLPKREETLKDGIPIYKKMVLNMRAGFIKQGRMKAKDIEAVTTHKDRGCYPEELTFHCVITKKDHKELFTTDEGLDYLKKKFPKKVKSFISIWDYMENYK